MVGPGTEMTKDMVFPRNRKAIKMSQKKRKAFLKALAITGKAIDAAKAAGYTTTIYINQLRKTDKDFEKQYNEALHAAGDALIQEAVRRAKDGVLEPEYYQGKVVGYKYKYSDTLLQFMLKGLRPELFRENLNINGTIKHDIGVALLPMTAPVQEDWEKTAIEVHQGQKALEDPKETIDVIPEQEGVKLTRS